MDSLRKIWENLSFFQAATARLGKYSMGDFGWIGVYRQTYVERNNCECVFDQNNCMALPYCLYRYILVAQAFDINPSTNCYLIRKVNESDMRQPRVTTEVQIKRIIN